MFSFFMLFSRVLIDDRKDLQDDWEAAGGIFILHTDTVSSLQQLREQGIIKPQLDANVHVETPKDKEADVAATTTTTTTTTTGADDETSKFTSKETQGIVKPQSDTKVEMPKEEEADTVTTSVASATTTAGEDEETSTSKETEGISKLQMDTKRESSKHE
jgi:hypothetical protein